MAQRHWLDPLARGVLRATGQIPAPRRNPKPEQQRPAGPLDGSDNEQVERDLLALKLRHNPALKLEDAEAVRHAAALGWRLDVNRATPADWLRLPDIEAAQVDLLLRLQSGGIQLSGLEDLQRVLELPETVVQSWSPLLEFRWYGEPALPVQAASLLDLNRATSQDLEGLGLDSERVRRLLRERGRGPFRDLADLQQRLQLPAALVEAWIGKVRFQPGPAGPVLPPAGKGV